jgi:hypothetical protein
MAKSWEEIKKEREEKVRSFSNPVQNNTSKMINQGFLTADPKLQQRKWEDIRKERGYVEPEYQVPKPNGWQPLENIKNNYTYGKLTETENQIWSEYRIKQTPDLLKKAQEATKLRENFSKFNQVGYGNALTKDFAQYVPQLINQEVSGFKEGIKNVPAGAVAGTGTAAVLGQTGPQLVTPEEIITLPAGAVLGGIAGYNAGRIVGVGKYSYDNMAGAAYKGLLDLGVPNDIALKISGEEALVNSLIEAAGAGVDVLTLGLGKLLTKPGTTAASKIAQSKIVSALKAYGVNLASEALEEAAQEKVSIENEKRAMKAAGLNRTTSDKDDLSRIIEAGKGGFNIALVGGGLNAAGNYATSAIVQKSNSKIIDKEYNALMEILPEESPTKQQNEEFKNRMVNVTDEVKKIMIDSAREELGVNGFESETEQLIKDYNQLSGQNETISSNSNKIVEQTFNQEHTSVKSQNKGSVNVNPITNIFNIQNLNNPKEVKQNVYDFYRNTIISDSNTSKPIMNKSSGMNIEVSRATINQTFQADYKYAKNRDNEIKVAAMANIVNLIQNGKIEILDNPKTPSSKVKYAEIKGTVNINGIPYEITMDIRRTDNGRKLFVHSLSTNYQQVTGKTSGVIYNGVDNRVRQQYPKVYDILDRMGKATNTKFKFVDTIYDPTGQMPGFANGQYDPTTDSIEIALDTFNPFMVVAKHEITHMLEKESPKLYKEYKGYVLEAMKENGTYDVQYERMAELYKSKGLEVDKNAIEDELVADATELFLTDENAINSLVAENKTLGQKILDVLRKLIEKIEDILEVARFTEGWMNTEQLRQAEKLWVNALSSVAEKQSVSTSKQAGIKNSLKDNELIFYRGTVPGETKRIDEPFTAAKGKTFVARKEKSALAYGKRIEKIKAKPGAKIIYENTKEFNKLIGKIKNNQSYVSFVNNAVSKAVELGYDIISFERDSDIGTVILNEDAVIRNYKEQKYSLKDDDVITQPYGKDNYIIWVGENNQIPFGDFDTEKEAREFYNKHRNRLSKYRHSSNLETDIENAETGKEIADLEKLLNNAKYIEDEYARYERRKSKSVSINKVIENIKNDRYRREDLESLAEQVSKGNWDDYEDLTDEELKSDLIEAIERYAEEMNPLERQYDKYGFSVRPPRNAKYSKDGEKPIVKKSLKGYNVSETDNNAKQKLTEKYIAPEIREYINKMKSIPETINDNSPQRIKYRMDKAFEYYNKFKTDNHDRNAYIIIGLPSAGKSTIAEPLAKRTNSMILDSDIIKMGDDSVN